MKFPHKLVVFLSCITAAMLGYWAVTTSDPYIARMYGIGCTLQLGIITILLAIYESVAKESKKK